MTMSHNGPPTSMMPPRSAKKGRTSWFPARILRYNAAISAIVLAAIVGVFAVSTQGLLVSPDSLHVMAVFAPEMILITIGLGLVLLTHEIDLSVGSMYVVTGVILGSCYTTAGLPLWLSALIALASGTIMGLVNGLLVVTTGVASFIVTLGTMWAFRGLMLVTVGPGTIPIFPPDDGFSLFSVVAGRAAALPVQVLWLLLIAGVLVYVRHFTRFGNWMQAVGSNESAARMMGVPTKRVKVLVFALEGFLCAFAGLIKVAHSNQAVPQSGDIVMLTALAGAIIGGVSLNGGRGDVIGPLLGGLTLHVISLGLIMMGVVEFWTSIVTAIAVIFTAFAFNKIEQFRVRSTKT